MNARRTRLVIVCEDSQHEAFVRRFLEGMGWNKYELRVEKSPSARGSAEQWVRDTFTKELSVYRARHARSGFVTIIDADTNSVADRMRQLEKACTGAGMEFRRAEEAVAIFIPKRNIETWIHHLQGEMVDEETAYQKLIRARDCSKSVDVLVEQCKLTRLAASTPPSLSAACDEYHSRIRPLK